MFQVIRVRILFAVLLAAAVLILLMVTISVVGQPAMVRAQEPEGDNADPFPVTDDMLADFGLFAADIIQASTFSLRVVKTADATTVDAGDTVTFRVSITNLGPDEAFGVFFYDDFPPEMTNVGYTFSPGAGAVHNSAAQPEDYVWLLGNGIAVNEDVIVTITGELTSARNVTVTNVAKAYAYSNPNTIYQSEVEVGIIGYDPNAPVLGPIYLPLIFKAPPPPPIVLAYHEDFNSGDPWFEFDTNGCKTENRDSKYWVDLDRTERTCLPPAKNENNPEKPYRTYGEFEVIAYHSEGLSDAAYGLFTNGEGGDNYYLFRIWPNDDCSTGGDWQLIRRRSGNSSTVLQGNCHRAIRQGSERNTLRIAHSSDRKLTVYVNGQELGSYTDSTSNHLTGTATGLYVRSADEDIRIKFDDFKVYKYN